MFKKTLLALALTGISGVATAATINNTEIKYSAEGIVNQTTFDLDADVNASTAAAVPTAAATGQSVIVGVGIDAGYQVGDKIVFTFPNDVFDISTNAALVAKGTADPSLTVGSPVYSNGNTVSFTITGATAVTKTNAAEIALSGIVLAKENVLAGGDVDVKFHVVSSVNNTNYEEKTDTIASVAEQLSASVTTPLDAVVNVSAERKVFEDTDTKGANGGVGQDQDFEDTLVVTPKSESYVKPTVISKITYKVNGDFSFMDTDSDGTVDYSVTTSGGTSLSAPAFAKDLQSFTVVDTATAATAVTFELEATDGTTVIPAQAYTVDTTVTHTPVSATSASSKAFSSKAGEWTLNGSSDKIAFLPFGNEYAQSITVTNTGTLEGGITVELTANGTTTSKLLTATATKNAVTNISLEVAAFAKELGIDGNAAIKVIVNAPKANIQVKGVYYHKASADRVLTY